MSDDDARQHLIESGDCVGCYSGIDRCACDAHLFAHHHASDDLYLTCTRGEVDGE